MDTEAYGAARLEVALAQAIINEVKYGSETSQLAEVSLLAAFQNRAVGKKLVEALHMLMPGLKYFSIGALLKDGVVVRTSNLAVEGPVAIEPRTLRGSAARVAARKHTTFHAQKRTEEETSLKYYELQEAWDVASATSVLTVPIPAVRTYESASIADSPPPMEETACDPASHVCPVLHSLNGTVGIVTLGLATEDLDLNGRQGKAFHGIAESLSPFLAYYADPVLKQLQQQIQAVANANAASVAKFKAKHGSDAKHAHPSNKRHSTDGSEVCVAENTVSPFSAAYPSEHKRRISTTADSASAQPEPRTEPAQTNPSPQPSRQAPNPFAQVATVAFSDSCAEETQRSRPALRMSGGAEPQQQPVSPFAAAAQDSGRLFSSHAEAAIAASQSAGKAAPPTQSLSSEQQQGTSSGPASREPGSGSGAAYSLPGASSSEEGFAYLPQDAAATTSGEAGSSQVPHQAREPDSSSWDTCYVFTRRPILSTHTRRYSTSTFLQGRLHTPNAHFSHVSNMDELVEEQSEEVKQQSVEVDHFSYVSLTSLINRRALSTPQKPGAEGPLPPAELQQQILAHASCPGPILLDLPFSTHPLLDAAAQGSAEQTHIALEGRFSKSGLQQGVVFGRVPAFSTAAAPAGSGKLSEESTGPPASPSRLGRQPQACEPADHQPLDSTASVAASEGADEGAEFQQAHEVVKPSVAAPASQGADEDAEFHQMHEVVKPAKSKDAAEEHSKTALQQHPFWMTFSEPQMEAGFNIWFGQRCSKVDTLFMLAATIYITQLLFFTWALADQQAEKWPLLGYIMLPVLMLQHGDTAWYLKHRCTILACMRVVLLAFLALVVPYIGQSHSGAATKWMDMSGLGPLVVVPLGLLVRFKVHVVLHTISCLSIVFQGLQTCMSEVHGANLPCQMASLPKLAVASCAPCLLLYLVELRARALYLQTVKC